MSDTSVPAHASTSRGARRRLVPLLLALLILVAPALVANAAVAAGAATTLTGVLSPTTVAYDGSATLSGTLQSGATPLSGQTVVLEGRPAGDFAFTTLATTTTSGTGAYTFTRTNQTSKVSLRARFVATPSFAGSVSPVRTLTVSAPLTDLVLSPATTTGALNSQRTWSGKTAPSLVGTSVEVQRKIGTTWTSEGWTGSVGDDGAFDATFFLSNEGVQNYRLFVPASTQLGTMASAPARITVGTLAISTSSLVPARQFKAYTAQLTTAFGEAPVHWTVDEPLPVGMTLSDSGQLAGTPTDLGSTPLTFRAFDALGQSASKTLTLDVLEPVAPTFLDTKLPGAQIGVPYEYRLRVAGGTAPVTMELTSGTLPAGLTFDPATRAVRGTPTTAGSSTATFRATDAAAHVATRTLRLIVGPTGNWDQFGHDAGRSGFNAFERTIGPDNASALGKEWSTDQGTDTIVVRGGVMYSSGTLPGTVGTPGIAARDLTSGEVLWKFALANGSCLHLALSATSLVCQSSSEVAAYSLTGTHARLWTSSDTDPGSQYSDLALSGAYVVTARVDTPGVTAYRLTDGAFRWFKAMPTQVSSLVVVGGKVFALDGDRNVRSWTLNTAGTPGWTLAATNINQLVSSAGLLLAREYDAGVTSVTWRSLVNGAVTKTFTSPRQIFGEIVADDHNVYVPTSLFDEFGGSSDMGVTAVSLTTGTEQWNATTDYPVRAGMAVGDSVLWVHASDLGRFRQPSQLVAVDTSNGTVLRRYEVSDTAFTPPVVANGRVILPTAFHTEVWGLSGSAPRVTSAILRVGWTTKAYAGQLQASGGSAPFSWDVVSGALPAGLSLSPTGAMSGTPTAAGASSFTVRVTDAHGRTARRALSIAVRTPAAAGWVTSGGVPGHTGTVAGEAGIDADTISTFARRYTTAALPFVSTSPGSGADEVVVSGSRVFGRTASGAIAAYSSVNGLNRTPVWTRPGPTEGNGFAGTPTLVGTPTTGTLYAVTIDNLLVAIGAGSGAVLWSTPLPEASSDQSVPGPLVLNGKVFVQTGDEVTAVDTTTHEVAWSKPMPGSNTFLNSNVSSSGTSVFALDGCDVVALNQTDGVEQWRARVPLTDMDCSGWWIFQGPGDKGTVVSGDTVFANFGFFGIAAFDVTTGDVRWRANPPAHNVTMAVTEQFVVADAFDDGISVLDRTTGDLVGRLGPDKVSPRSGVTAVGDLVLYNTTDGRVGAVDLATMEQVWTSSVVSAVAMPGRPVVSGGRIWGYSSTDFNGTASQIVALGP